MIPQALQTKIEESYKVLQLAAEMSKLYYQTPLIITYSGGKDSDTVLQLAIECLNFSDFEVLNSHTTVDAPETVYYIRDKFKELHDMGIKAEVQYPRYKNNKYHKDGEFKSMWSLIVDKQMPPTRLMRYCCQELKETSTPNRFIATGVRAAESTGRKGRNVFATRGKTKSDAYYYYYEHVRDVFVDSERERERTGGKPNDYSIYDCRFIENAKKKNELICNPIYEWTDTEVWEFIRGRGLKYNPLYDRGYPRIGCIGCPLAGNQKWGLEMNPIYALNYKRAFNRMVERRKESGKHQDSIYSQKWKDGESVYKWWIQDPTIDGQMTIDDFIQQEGDEG